MYRTRVSVTWWGEGLDGRQIAVETFAMDGQRLSCITWEAMPSNPLAQAAAATEAEVHPRLF